MKVSETCGGFPRSKELYMRTRGFRFSTNLSAVPMGALLLILRFTMRGRRWESSRGAQIESS
jgi:hypothetical protein